MSELQTGTLRGYGRLDWAHVSNRLDGWLATWADLDGWHIGEPVPQKAPLATHLWAWRSESGPWARVRVDGNEATLAILSTNGAPSGSLDSLTDPVLTEQVPFRVRDSVPWGQDTTLPGRADPIRNLKVSLIEVVDANPITFLSANGDGQPYAER